MLIVCHLSYQDSEAIMHMKQNAVNPTEHQYSYNASETLRLTIEMPSCSKSLIGALWSTKLLSPKLPSCDNFC